MPRELTEVLMVYPAPMDLEGQEDMAIFVQGVKARPADAPPTKETISLIHNGLSSCKVKR